MTTHPHNLNIVQATGTSMGPTFRCGGPVMVYVATPQAHVDGVWVIQQASGVLGSV